MPNHKGSEGTLTVDGNVVAELTSFNLNVTTAIVPDTELGDTWETNKAGRSSWDGTANAWWDETDTTGQGAMTEGAEVSAVFLFEGNDTGDTSYTGSAIVSGISRDSGDGNSIVTASFTLTGNGALTAGTVV